MPEYLKRLLAALAQGNIQPGDISLATVSHDSWCGIHADRDCNCDPEIVISSKQGQLKVLADGSVEVEYHQ